MQNSKLIGGNSFLFGSYDLTVMPHNERKLDLYVRDNFKMQIYEAKSYELSRINVKTIQDGLKKNRKDITVSFNENNCDGVDVLELIVSIEIPLLPKITETIFLAKTKTLKDSEVVNAKLLDIKKAIIKNKQTLADVSKSFGGKVVKYVGDVNYASASKQTVATLNIPEKGKYMVTVSSFLRGNANTYLTVDLTKGDICPGAYYGIPTTTTSNPLPYFIRAMVDVTEDNFALQLSGSNGSSYTWSMSNLIMTAEKVAAN